MTPDNDVYAGRCTANKVQYGISLRCDRRYKHAGNHRWTKDEDIYPFGRLDPEDPFDQAIVKAFNKGAAAR